jgi:DNA replication protein DnaC
MNGLYFFRPTSTLADAILDRLVHQAHSLNLDGESLRKKGKPE